MTNEYDHSTFTVHEMNFSFATMSVSEIALAQATLEADKLAKEAAKTASQEAAKQAEVQLFAEATETIAIAKPKFSAFKKKDLVQEVITPIEVPNEELKEESALANEADIVPEAPKPKATFKPFKKKEALPPPTQTTETEN
jgi:hypothetical protein